MANKWALITDIPEDFILQIIKEGETNRLEKATILKPDKAGSVKMVSAEGETFRDCNIGWVNSEDILKEMVGLFKPINKELQLDIDVLEPLQYTVYNIEQFYGWHQDNYIEPKDVEDEIKRVRKISFTMWLNDPEEYEGGDLEIEFGGPGYQSKLKKFKEIRGSILYFPSHCFHQVTPITKGTRKSLVGWFGGPVWK